MKSTLRRRKGVSAVCRGENQNFETAWVLLSLYGRHDVQPRRQGPMAARWPGNGMVTGSESGSGSLFGVGGSGSAMSIRLRLRIRISNGGWMPLTWFLSCSLVSGGGCMLIYGYFVLLSDKMIAGGPFGESRWEINWRLTRLLLSCFADGPKSQSSL